MAKKITPAQNDPAPAGENNLAVFPSSVIPASTRPDKVAFVDLITAGGFNENLHTIRAMSYELGVGLRGSFNNLNQRISNVITPDGKLVMPETVFSVGKENADFTTIQDAVNEITDASPTKRYILNIYPGVYEESVVMKPNIILKAFLQLPVLPNGPYMSPVILQPPSGSCIKCTEPGDYLFDGIYFRPGTTVAVSHAPGYESMCDLYFSNCILYGTGTPSIFLSEGAYFDYNFQNCVVRAATRHAQLIYAENPDVSIQKFKAVDCYVLGTINIYDTAIERLDFILTRSYMDGKLYTDESAAHVETYRSYWYNYQAPLLDLYATDSSLIECSESSFNTGATPAPFSTHGGSSQPIVETQNCTFGFAKPATFEWSLYGGFNHFGDCLIMKVDRL